MEFPKANSFPTNLVRKKIMGPNPLKLCEEMLYDARISPRLDCLRFRLGRRHYERNALARMRVQRICR